MSVAGRASVLAVGAAWRLGVPGTGGRLAAALGSDDDQERLIAGMVLVRGGAKAIPVLTTALRRGRRLPHVLRVIGDAAPAAFAVELERHAAADDPDVRQAARDALRAAAAAAAPAPAQHD